MSPDEDAATGRTVEFVDPAKMALLFTTTLWLSSRTIEYGAEDGEEIARPKKETLSAVATSHEL